MKTYYTLSDKTIEQHQATTFATLLKEGYFVSIDENALCPEHNVQVVPTMLRFYQCPDCAATCLKMVKLKQQPIVDALIADWERRQSLTDAQREAEDKEKAEKYRQKQRQQKRGF